MPRRLTRLRRMRRPLLALVVLVVLLAVGYAVQGTRAGRHSAPAATRSSSPAGTLPTVALSALPAQAGTTWSLVKAGGPFPYPRNDGVVFHNEEHRLPTHADGWYHEYTVPTPGSSTRGARRLITGRDGTVFYTGDHYETFSVVDVGR